MIHKLAYRFRNHENLHVRGYKDVQPDGTNKFNRVGTLFVRDNGTGGVMYVTEGDNKYELAVFVKKPWNEKHAA